MTLAEYYNRYTPVGDILAMALSILLAFLITTTYVTKKRSFLIFRTMIATELVAAISDIAYHFLLQTAQAANGVIVSLVYFFRILQHAALFFILYLFIFYLVELLFLPGKVKKKFYLVGNAGLFVMIGLDVLLTLTGNGFYFDPRNDYIRDGKNVFGVAYIFFVGILFFLLIRYRERLVTQIFRGLMATFAFCLVIRTVQGAHRQTSFTTAIFILPIITLMYLLHSNPYETTTGAVNEASFNDLIADSYAKKQKLMLLFLHLQDYDGYNSFTEEMQFEIFRFFTGIVKKATLFRVTGARLALVFRESDNPDMEGTTKRIEEAFERLYERFHLNFKTVIMESDDDISAHQDYGKFVLFVEDRVPMNSYYHVTEEDKEQYKKQQMIIGEMEDIARQGDLDDPRVLVFCQPVYHVRTQMYDTAEALMRLELPNLGMVFPDQFIPLAEQNNLIHSLSLVILNKTCREIRKLMDEKFVINRISINFAVQEVYEENFCKDILDIISKNGIGCDKIAIELTESQNTADFEMIKARIEELQEHGIKFYLDDFGTGYSNVERIMELPFDIIKFDRSLVIESSKNKNSEYMVNTFADMFRNLKYRVLYEGVEDEMDEERCIRMYAQYLQGYKYSKPIRIERLREFLTKAA